MHTGHKLLLLCCVLGLNACTSLPWTSQAASQPISTAVLGNGRSLAEANYQLGRYYQGQNRYDLAIKAYQKALAAEASFVEARNGLGVSYSAQGQYPEAIEAFQLALQQAPNFSHLYSNMGYAYYLQGKYSESLLALEQATTLDPNNARALNNLTLVYAKTGQPQPAVPAALPAPAVPSLASAEIMPAAPMPVTPSATTQRYLAGPDEHLETASNTSELQFQSQSGAWFEPAAASLRLEVANGNGLNGAAKKVGQYLRGQGYAVVKLTNQKPFRVQATQIQYRAGHQAAAQLLKLSLSDNVQLVQRNDMQGGVSLRLLLGQDLRRHIARYDLKASPVQLASYASRI